MNCATLKPPSQRYAMTDEDNHSAKGVLLHCGWGRLLFAHTFVDPTDVAREILREEPGKRDIAYYLTDPHLVLNHAPQEMFLDPSDTYRLKFRDYEASERKPLGFSVGAVETREELDEINRIYQTNHMVPFDADFVWKNRESEKFTYLVARQNESGQVLGVTMGVDHMACFEDIENGCSLWALAVDPQAELPGIGQFLVRALVEMYQARGREQLDLSVMHDNENAIKLYKKLNFQRVPIFAVKKCNPINEKLFIGNAPTEGFNPYATIIINEALRRGIAVDPIDPPRGYFRLSLGGRSIVCRESLSEMTSAIALSRTDDKQVTHELLHEAGLRVPAQIIVEDEAQARAFLGEHRRVVVKPLHGEQGAGVFVDLSDPDEVLAAIAEARKEDETVLMEQYCEGVDLRIIVINEEVVAAAVRKAPEIIGTGEHTAQELIESLSRRRSAATGGESKIPLDDETRRCLKGYGYTAESVIPKGEALTVRKAANLHTGGTIHDVTAKLHPTLAEAAIAAAKAIEIPVTGLDFIVPDHASEDYVIIEANERPGLANHEPQPTAEKFIDFLFPHSVRPPQNHRPAKE